MTLELPTNKLLTFVNKNLRTDFPQILSVTVMTKTESIMFKGIHRWEIEIVCEPNSVDAGTKFEMGLAADKYIRFFGEPCDGIEMHVRYIVK